MNTLANRRLLRRICARRLLHLSLFVMGIFVVLGPATLRGEDWPKYRRDLANTGRSAEQGISSANVAALMLKWKFAADDIITGSPAVATINGTSMVFFGTWSGSFYAISAVTGAQVWKYSISLSVPTPSCIAITPWGCEITGSAAVAQGMVYFGSRSGYVYALDAATGAEVWKIQLGDPLQGYEIWSSPAVYNGVVYVGTASHSDVPCVPGSVVALNAATGTTVWNFSTVDQTSCPAGVCVGAAVWSSPAVDTANNIVYAVTGNPGSTCNPATANATRYPDSILAINASTGALWNYFQAISNDNQDLDFGSSPVLHTAGLINQCQANTRIRNFVTAVNKNSIVYTVPRGASGLTGGAYQVLLDGGEIIASPALVPHVSQASCSGGTRTVFTNDLIVPTFSGNVFDVSQNRNGPTSMAWETAVGATIYSAPASIQDLIFFGAQDKNFYAVTTAGTVVWHYTAGAGIASGPAISNGRIYVGSYDHRLYAFSINGQ